MLKQCPELIRKHFYVWDFFFFLILYMAVIRNEKKSAFLHSKLRHAQFFQILQDLNDMFLER